MNPQIERTQSLTAQTWAARGPSIFAPPTRCTQSQASEIAQSKRLMKKPGKSVQLANSAPKATKPKCTWGGAQPGSGRPALDLDLPAMRAYRATGKTWGEVAKEFDCSTFTARTKCKTTADAVAKILRDNTASRFCTVIGNQAGSDKTARIKGRSL